MPVLLGGVMLSKISFGVLAFVFIAYFLLGLSNHEKAVVCALMLCKLLGFFSSMFGLAVPGTLIAFVLMLVFLRGDIKQLFSYKNIVPILYILSTFIILFFLYKLTGSTSYSDTKISRTFIALLVDTIGFILLVQFDDINTERIAPIFWGESLLIISFLMSNFSFFPLNGLFDFNSFRETYYELKKMHIDMITYHAVGVSSFIAAAFYLSRKVNLTSVFDYVFLFSCGWAILVSGARQAVVGFILLIVFWIAYRHREFKLSTIIFSLLLFAGFISLLQILDLEIFQTVFSENTDRDEALNRNFDYPLEIISQHLLYGIGFGNYYNPHSMEIYPHNIILELLCELGIVGTTILLLPTLLYILTGRFHLKNVLANGTICLYIIFPFIVRSMISSDLSENIALFCGFFILFSVDNNCDEESVEDDISQEYIVQDI